MVQSSLAVRTLSAARECQDALVSNGAIQLLLEAMQSFSHTADLQKNVCGALARLSLDCDEYRKVVEANEGPRFGCTSCPARGLAAAHRNHRGQNPLHP